MTSMARETWTDERLDDLKDGMHREFAQVYRRFEEVDRKFEQVHTEIRELRAHTDAGFAASNARIDGLSARFDTLNRTIILGMASIVVTLLGAIATNALS
jgi:chlorite dismutase